MKIVLKGYDEFLVTEKNIERFLNTVREAGYHGIFYTADNGDLNIDISTDSVPDHFIEACIDYWEADHSTSYAEFTDFEAVALALYEILDDIDTIGDIAKGNDKIYRQLVQGRLRDRFRFCYSDGFNVGFSTPPSDYTIVRE